MKHLRIVVTGLWLLVLGSGLLHAQNSGYRDLTFWDISAYSYDPNDPYEPEPVKKTGTIPASVMKLSGQKVVIMGTMTPLDFEGGGSTQFVLSISQDQCGFGVTPRINEWALVTMANKKKAYPTGMDVLVKGTFQVREQVVNGRVVALYHILADSVQ